MNSAHTLVIGIGNRYRGDDAFGCIVAAELARKRVNGLQCIEHDGEPAALIDCWQGAGQVLLVDAVSSGDEGGKIFRFDLSRQPLPETYRLYSTHAFGVHQAVELARALNKLPPRISLLGAEGESFDAGVALSPALEVAKNAVVAEILASLET